MKFGTVEETEPSTVPNCMLICEYLVFPAQKMPKVAEISNFFAPQGQTPCLMSMKFVGFMRVIGLQKLLTFGVIRLVN